MIRVINLISLYVNEVIETYELTYPLDIHGFASTLGFNIKYVDTGKNDAYTIITGGKKLILLNQNVSFEERINFILAHELGHYFIPHHLEPLYACNIDEMISTAVSVAKDFLNNYLPQSIINVIDIDTVEP